MPEVGIPAVVPGRWRGVIFEQHDAAGQALWAVTVRAGRGRALRRRWFSNRGVALAHAVEMADLSSLPLFDLGSDIEPASDGRAP